jgi:ABC-2 type transport system ATP-binding protein
LPGVRSVAVEDGDPTQLVVVRAEADAEVTPAVLACLSGFRLGRVATREPSLEDAYVELLARP